MYSLQFFPDTEFGDVAVLLHGLESDIVPSRTDCGNGSRSGPDAVVQHGVPLVGVGAYQVLDQCHRLLGRMIECPCLVLTDVGYLLSAMRTGTSFISP